jgi:class 3 adenylate cyclase
VSIAFAVWEGGPGVPVVQLHSPLIGHLEWTEPPEVEPYLPDRSVVIIDGRCQGLSDREVPDVSVEARALDVEAVVQKLGLEKFCLHGMRSSCMAAISYMAKSPGRATRAYFSSPFINGRRYWEQPRWRALLSLAEADWNAYTEAYAWIAFGAMVSAETVRYRAARLRATITQGDYMRLIEAEMETDLSVLLPSIKVPVLAHIFTDQEGTTFPSIVHDVVKGLTNGRLVSTQGTPTVAHAFFKEGDLRPEASGELPTGTCVILFTDIVESTALTERMGDEAFRGRAREVDAAVRRLVSDAGGVPVEGTILGDGVLAVFTSAKQAIDCALRCNAAAEAHGLSLHIGLHAGDVIRDGNNVYGGAVNLASRIKDASAPGQILVSDVVRGLARTSAGVGFADAGERALKGIAGEVRLYELTTGSPPAPSPE